jgi:hypothetical protein
LRIGSDGLALSRRDPDKDPGYTIDTFPKALQEAFLKEYQARYPERERELRAAREELYQPPEDYSDLDHHLADFVEAVRAGTPVVEDASFGLRAAGPALLCNLSSRERRAVRWDPEAMRIPDAGPA